MGASLEALAELRDIELQITDIRRQLAVRRGAVRRQTERLKAAEVALAQAQSDLKHTQVMADSADVDVKARDEQVNKLRDNLNTVRTNKEYAAILAQLNNEKAERSRIETRALELMAQVEDKRSAAANQEAVAKEESARLANLTIQAEQAEGSFKDRLATLEQERNQATARLDDKTVDLFNRLSERFEGEAMAKVMQVHPRRQEYICEGCNMAVTAERANALLARDEVVTCGSCGRILYMDSGS